MLKCKDVAHRAGEYLEGSPDKRLKWQMRLHLAMCRHCRRFVRHLTLTQDLSTSVAQFEPCSPDKSQKIVQKIRSKS
ncbi:zf-HC2 domain-containing protein [Gilvimarinus agarilyticus]|uniref:zf-HC2 domain-containing protein n=1 Tax=unclassified Gilvimarinus TaxID=2642066 RepID=UPI001C08DD08|nr:MULTISPECIES: zf-HC2 domain-containing protein [unclassified Gilvimarinus]MBU2885974.1 zf-HC2 domain-containing protein [Gilvimarinus agarilyticus]MDO6570720.1 zf-HC2 domain-containing protein [Gilvimarinus sp. 2_MG-2023]MDO6747687.1 zf-HC2 domain-containing protein [Gilvimarinus sp. 1_MG-2023]